MRALWIIGVLNYMGVKHAFYDKVMVDLVKYVKNKGLAVKWKKELMLYLKQYNKPRALKVLKIWMEYL